MDTDTDARCRSASGWPEPPFVGRALELSALDGLFTDPSARLLHVEARGGMGKTSLLRAFGRERAQRGLAVARIDGATTEAHPAAVRAALSASPRWDLIVLDDLDALEPSHHFLAREVFPALPAATRVVSASRQPLPTAWTLDPDLHHAMRVLRLGPLDLAGTRLLARAHAVPEAQAEALFRASDGHPLIACLLASAVRGSSDGALLRPALDEQAIVREILRHAPSEAHRQGLVALGLSDVLDAPLLAAMMEMPVEAARDVMDWIAQQPFVEEAEWGLRAHALVRPVIEQDAGRLTPALRLLRRAQEHLLGRLDFGRPDRARALWRAILHAARREHEMVLYVGDAPRRLFPDTPTPGEWELVLEVIARHEGASSARACEEWRDQPGTELTVLRDLGGAARAFAIVVLLEGDRPVPVEDPVAEATWRGARLGPGQRAVLARSWMSIEHHMRPSSDLLALFQAVNAMLLFRPGVDLAASVHALPELWQIPEDHVLRVLARPSIGATPYVVFGSDFRTRSREAFAAAWVRGMRGPAGDEAAPPALAVETARDEAADDRAALVTVRAALRDYHRGDALGESPLVDHPEVQARAGDATLESRVRALRELLVERTRGFGEQGEDLRQRRVLDASFFAEPRKQQTVAADLGLTLATYRRHLDRAVRRLAATLARPR